MGTKGLPACAPVDEQTIAGRRRVRRVAIIMATLVLPVLVGCSSNSSWSTGSWSSNPAPNKTATATSTPNVAAPPAAQTAQQGTVAPSSYAAPPAVPPDDPRNSVYPNVSLVDLFKDNSPSATSAPNMPHPPSTYTPSGQPYSPPPAQTTAASASNLPHPPTTYTPSGQPYSPPGQTAAAPPQPAPPPTDADLAASAYPTETLWDLFRR